MPISCHGINLFCITAKKPFHICRQLISRFKPLDMNHLLSKGVPDTNTEKITQNKPTQRESFIGKAL